MGVRSSSFGVHGRRGHAVHRRPPNSLRNLHSLRSFYHDYSGYPTPQLMAGSAVRMPAITTKCTGERGRESPLTPTTTYEPIIIRRPRSLHTHVTRLDIVCPGGRRQLRNEVATLILQAGVALRVVVHVHGNRPHVRVRSASPGFLHT